MTYYMTKNVIGQAKLNFTHWKLLHFAGQLKQLVMRKNQSWFNSTKMQSLVDNLRTKVI